MSNEWKHATPDQSKILVKHGIVIDTFWYWLNGELFTLQEVQRQDCNANRIPAPDVAELGRVLPYVINSADASVMLWIRPTGKGGWLIRYEDTELESLWYHDQKETEAQARAAAVIYLIENKRATWDQEKQMLIAV